MRQKKTVIRGNPWFGYEYANQSFEMRGRVATGGSAKPAPSGLQRERSRSDTGHWSPVTGLPYPAIGNPVMS